MLKTGKIAKARLVLSAVFMLLFFTATTSVVYADTDGNELKTTKQPDKLVIHLGADLADAKFELKLDSGIFPAPVVASSSGVVTMDLGGSKTYTLTRIVGEPPAELTTQPEEPQQQQEENQETKETETKREDDPIMSAPSEKTAGVPLGYLFVFLGGLGVIAGGLIVSKVIKKRREYYSGDQDEYDDYDE